MNLLARILPCGLALSIIATILPLSSCSDDNKEVFKGKINPETFATMTTRNISTLISDSGITRYRIDAPLWLAFDEASEPRWTFPQGLHLERYNDLFQVDAEIDCDSATYFRNRQIWRLDGFVDIRNMADEKFRTQQLFWDQRRQKIYSDSFIHIERADRVIEGYGFESNEQMTDYHVINVSGIFPAATDRPEHSDSLAADSTKAQPTSARRHSVVIPSAGGPGEQQIQGNTPTPTPRARQRHPRPTAIDSHDGTTPIRRLPPTGDPQRIKQSK